MSDERTQCPVCGETWLEGWDHCPSCGSPYPTEDLTVALDAERRRRRS